MEQMGSYNRYDAFRRRSSGYYGVHNYYDEEPEINSLNGWFDYMSEPLYEFRVQDEDEPCVINETCLTTTTATASHQ
jgi:hypothetical protein